MFEELQHCGIDIQSFLLLKEGIKPAIRTGLGEEGVEIARKNADKLGLKVIITEYKELYGQSLENKRIHAYYSLDRNIAEQTWLAERDGNRKKLGQLLGYPECCVDNFIELLSINEVDRTLMSLKKTKKKPSFYCNNIFVFDSKLGNEGIKVYITNHNIFNNPDVSSLFLIRHVPCSYDCKHSIWIGKKTLKLLKNNSPDLAMTIMNTLKKPVLYWNYFEWIILNGRLGRESNTIEYDGFLNYKSLINEEIKKIIGSGDSIKIDEKNISIFNADVKMGEIARKDSIPVFINFR